MLPYALTIFGLPHAAGLLPTQSGESPKNPLSTMEFLDAAVSFGLSGVELPMPTDLSMDAFRDALMARHLSVVIAHNDIADGTVSGCIAALQMARQVGATVMRATVSRILCGERSTISGGWNEHLQSVATRLREILPVAEELGVAVALENHQDATSDELIALFHESGESPAYGITLDTGNPLAVAEEPVAFARKVAPYVRHLHLKDYTLHRAETGYHLIRCAAGKGVIDFPAILETIRGNNNAVLPGIEIAAQHTRTIPYLLSDWWSSFPDRDISDRLKWLQFVRENEQPFTAESASVWERGGDSDAVVREEWETVKQSVRYFQSL